MLTTHKEKEEKINIEEAYKIYKEEAGEQIEEIELKKSFFQKYRDKVEQQADIKRKIKSEQRYSDTDRKLEKMRMECESIQLRQRENPNYILSKAERRKQLAYMEAERKAKLKKQDDEKKELLRKAKRMKRRRSAMSNVPKSVQETIPYIADYEEGIFEILEGVYSKTFEMQDINYQVSKEAEQIAIFCKYGEFLNYFSEDMLVNISIVNKRANQENQEDEITFKMRHDNLNEHRKEYNRIIMRQLASGKNDIIQNKYVTITQKANNPFEAVLRFHRTQQDVINNLQHIGANSRILSTTERLSILHDIFRPNNVGAFRINYDFIKKQGISSKDYVAPASFFFDRDYFQIDGKYYRVMFLNNLPASITDDFIAKISNTDFPCIINIMVHPVEQAKGLDRVNKQITGMEKQVKSYADDVIGLYNKLKDDNEIITLYNNLSGEEIAIEKDTILSSIPNADDFTNIIEPVFNVLMITRYSMTVEESQKKETYVYLWNLLNNLYSEKLSMEYCDSPDEDGVYYAKETCLRSSDTKYHKKYSGRNCCEESYSCKGHTSYCTDLSKCTNKTIAGKCGGHTTYCTDADLKSCTNKEYHFKCNGYKECLGHRRTRIVMDFNGINALIAEEWDDRINELQLKDTLTDKETEELKLLISNRNFCLAYVDFLKLQDDSYSTDYSVTGNVTGGNGNDTVDLGQYDFDESIGAKIAEAGLQKIGYNYAFGGLTWCNDTTKKGSVGIDCSGFTYILTKEITGKTIPRTAAAQSQGGISINSLADAKAGDFIFYGRNGVTGVGHVGIYLGNGKIVHASNPNDGVKISNATYKQILAIRRYW